MNAILSKGDEPPSSPGELASAAATTQCLAAWRMTQGIYRFDPTLYEALIATPLAGDIPADVLLWLPQWCVYIETPGMSAPIKGGASVPVLGLWYWLDHDGRRMALCIGLDLDRRPPLVVQHVPLVGTIESAIDATLAEWASAIERGNTRNAPPPEYREAARAFLPPALSLVLYLCSRSGDVTGRDGAPANPRPIRTRRRGERLYPADGPRQWDVGLRLGAALRSAMHAARESEGGSGRSVRPHVRSAHWHTYLSGPRAGVDPSTRRRDLRWMPPIPIAVEDYDSLPATVRPVREPK